MQVSMPLNGIPGKRLSLESVVRLLQEKPTLVTREETPQGRLYRGSGYGGLLPGVTSVLSIIDRPALRRWQVNQVLEAVRELITLRLEEELFSLREPAILDAVLQEAAERPWQVRDEAVAFGSAVHSLIAVVLAGELVAPPPGMGAALQAFERWRATAGVDICLFAAEMPVFSLRHGYAGAIDAVGWRDRDGALIALAWKTGKGIYREYALQVGAYAEALEEMTGLTVAEAWVVRLGKEQPLFIARPVRNWRAAFEAFRCALGLYAAMGGEIYGPELSSIVLGEGDTLSRSVGADEEVHAE